LRNGSEFATMSDNLISAIISSDNASQS